jgi:hypothetical protein
VASLRLPLHVALPTPKDNLATATAIRDAHRTSLRQSQAQSQALSSAGRYNKESRPEGRISLGAKQRSSNGGDRSGIESASTCQITACDDRRQRHRRHRRIGRGARSRTDRNRDGSRVNRNVSWTNQHRNGGDDDGGAGDVEGHSHDESGAAKRIRIKASEPRQQAHTRAAKVMINISRSRWAVFVITGVRAAPSYAVDTHPRRYHRGRTVRPKRLPLRAPNRTDLLTKNQRVRGSKTLTAHSA